MVTVKLREPTEVRYILIIIIIALTPANIMTYNLYQMHPEIMISY